jgi:hypothetical protein
MYEGWDLPRGFSGKGARHKIGSKGYGLLQGVFANRHLPPLIQTKDRGGSPSAALVAIGAGAPSDEKLGKAREKGEELGTKP